jgi:hypothetical protein
MNPVVQERSLVTGVDPIYPSGAAAHSNAPGIARLRVVIVSVAAKKGTSLAVETEPVVRLRSGLHWGQK